MIPIGLEKRAYLRRTQGLNRQSGPHQEGRVPFFPEGIEDHPICPRCGHIYCDTHSKLEVVRDNTTADSVPFHSGLRPAC